MSTPLAMIATLAAGVALALPDPIAQAFKATFPGAVIRMAQPEKENGVTVYDVEFQDGDLERECDIAEDGTILNIATAVDPKSVPEAVTKAFVDAAGGGRVTRVERAEIRALTKHGKVVPLDVVRIEYEAELTSVARDGEVTVASDGAIVEPVKWWKRGDRDSH